MDDYLFILIALMVALGINLIAWIINDIKQTKKENDEIERWLNQGERHAKK